MSNQNKPREEPKLGMEDDDSPTSLYKKKWPKEEDLAPETLEPEEDFEQEIAGILEHPSYKELEEKLTAAENQVLRAVAEQDNIRRRSERDVTNAHKYALEKFAADLLPVVDSLDRALLSEVGGNDLAKKIHEGIELTMNLMLKTLEKYHVKQIDPKGQPFNPELHQAIATAPSDQAPNIVIEVLQKGYTLNDRLIRPALVVVASE